MKGNDRQRQKDRQEAKAYTLSGDPPRIPRRFLILDPQPRIPFTVKIWEILLTKYQATQRGRRTLDSIAALAPRP